ncbi:MAG: NAD(FAD)-utilizing dehydrogenase [Rhodospirillaceae bacterium BRH_c57]|nr:MAG: NAD(FAD)-utilizing dehydrogenase [Rhodospirillaceae bacterium BRH_c57]
MSAVAVIGGGPAGLMAAQALAEAGCAVDLYDSMPSVGRKFLMAGKSGMNLTHAEDLEPFLGRYGARRAVLEPLVRAFDNAAVRAWAEGLGVETFVGSSGRVFPTDFKAAPLLRSWLRRLKAAGVRVHVRHRWQGWDDSGALRFDSPGGVVTVRPAATVLALGGASWPQLGSDAAWVPWLRARGVEVQPFRPANCGFDVAWSAHFRERFAGQPVKPVVLSCGGQSKAGEFVVTENGIEGGGVYALSAPLRDAIARDGHATVLLDLMPGRNVGRVEHDLSRPRGARSLSNHLRRTLGLEGVKVGLLREVLAPDVLESPPRLAAALKALPLRLNAPRPITEAISSAGGVPFEALDDGLMIRNLPGVFCAGEMLDWEAPTGGYLLTACFATGLAAGRAAAAWTHPQS